jgi:hypothetical protein
MQTAGTEKEEYVLYVLTFHKLIWSVDGSVSIAPVSSVGHKVPSPLS